MKESPDAFSGVGGFFVSETSAAGTVAARRQLLDLTVSASAGGCRTIGRVIDHVDIRVSDRDASQRFYDTVLTVLGKERTDYPEYLDWGNFSIVADGQPVAKHLHIAFHAPSHELVDAFHRAGVEAGYTDEGGGR